MKRILIKLSILFALFICKANFAGPGLLFNISATGNSGNANIILCLNGKGPLSCQNFNVSALTLKILATIPNHIYPAAGIKVNMPGYVITSGCTPISNGYCLFSVSNTASATITLAKKTQYNVVFDAGSSGTRVFVYQTMSYPNNPNPVIVELFHETNNNPLATCTINTVACVSNTIQPLLADATKALQNYNIPPSQAIASVLGTAGMRLLTPSQQATIYRAVAALLASNKYIVGQTQTITGQQEGFYQWLDVNYLSKTFGLPYTKTYGVIEMGGASTQVVFVTSSASNPNVIPVTINGMLYDLYSISFLGLGQNQARTAMNNLPLPNDPNFCYPVGYNSGSIVGNFIFSGTFSCSTNYNDVLSAFPILSTISALPGFSSQRYYGIDNIFNNLKFLNALSLPVTASSVNAAMSVCNNDYAQLQVLYPTTPNLFNKCADSTFTNSFLYSGASGLNFGNNTLLPVANINGETATFTLGYVYLMNKTPKICNKVNVC